MKGTVKITSAVLSVVLAFTTLTAFSAVSRADSDTYHFKSGTTDLGEHLFADNADEAESYVFNSILNRVEFFSFYYAPSEYQEGFSRNIVEKAMEHNPSVPNGGDYLAKCYNTYKYTDYTIEGAYEGRTLHYIVYNFNYFTTAEEEQIVGDRIKSICDSMGLSGKSQLEKLCAIYDWITANIKYDYDNSTLEKNDRDTKTYTAYNALVNGKAVCQGIASLFYRMLLANGIENRIVYCMNHCWNVVKIGERYYNCDVTWDIGMPKSSYENFLRGKETSFKDEHSYRNDNLFLGLNVSDTDYGAVHDTFVAVSESGAESKAVADITPAENVLNFSSRLYTVVLGRECEADGLNYWATELANKRLDGASAARSFIMSDEFKAKGLDNEDYLEVLYGTFFGREMDQGGRDYWMSVLASDTSRETVLEGFIYSDEWKDICKSYGIESGAASAATPPAFGNNSIRAFAERLYTTVLNRNAEQDGLNYWSDMIASGSVTGTNAAYNFVFGDEFVKADVSNGEFVKRLYRLFMDREADQGGYDYWMSRFDNGASRQEVFSSIAGSEEFGKICDNCGIAR